MWHGATPGGLCHGTRGWGGSSWMAWGLVVDGMGARRGWHGGSSWWWSWWSPVADILVPGLFGWSVALHAYTLTCDAWSVHAARKNI